MDSHQRIYTIKEKIIIKFNKQNNVSARGRFKKDSSLGGEWTDSLLTRLEIMDYLLNLKR